VTSLPSKLLNVLGFFFLGREVAQPSANELYAMRRLEVYKALKGLSIADSLGILTDIVAETLAQDVTSMKTVQDQMPVIHDLQKGMIAGDFMFLLGGSLSAYIQNILPTSKKLAKETAQT
jgi:hypothetical protein